MSRLVRRSRLVGARSDAGAGGSRVERLAKSPGPVATREGNERGAAGGHRYGLYQSGPPIPSVMGLGPLWDQTDHAQPSNSARAATNRAFSASVPTVTRRAPSFPSDVPARTSTFRSARPLTTSA